MWWDYNIINLRMFIISNFGLIVCLIRRIKSINFLSNLKLNIKNLKSEISKFIKDIYYSISYKSNSHIHSYKTNIVMN